jgi:hypothetical protein
MIDPDTGLPTSPSAVIASAPAYAGGSGQILRPCCGASCTTLAKVVAAYTECSSYKPCDPVAMYEWHPILDENGIVIGQTQGGFDYNYLDTFACSARCTELYGQSGIGSSEIFTQTVNWDAIGWGQSVVFNWGVPTVSTFSGAAVIRNSVWGNNLAKTEKIGINEDGTPIYNPYFASGESGNYTTVAGKVLLLPQYPFYYLRRVAAYGTETYYKNTRPYSRKRYSVAPWERVAATPQVPVEIGPPPGDEVWYVWGCKNPPVNPYYSVGLLETCLAVFSPGDTLAFDYIPEVASIGARLVERGVMEAPDPSLAKPVYPGTKFASLAAVTTAGQRYCYGSSGYYGYYENPDSNSVQAALELTPMIDYLGPEVTDEGNVVLLEQFAGPDFHYQNGGEIDAAIRDGFVAQKAEALVEPSWDSSAWTDLGSSVPSSRGPYVGLMGVGMILHEIVDATAKRGVKTWYRARFTSACCTFRNWSYAHAVTVPERSKFYVAWNSAISGSLKTRWQTQFQLNVTMVGFPYSNSSWSGYGPFYPKVEDGVMCGFTVVDGTARQGTHFSITGQPIFQNVGGAWRPLDPENPGGVLFEISDEPESDEDPAYRRPLWFKLVLSPMHPLVEISGSNELIFTIHNSKNLYWQPST